MVGYRSGGRGLVAHLTTACRRRLPASARTSLPLSAAPDAQRSASGHQGSLRQNARHVLSSEWLMQCVNRGGSRGQTRQSHR
jgi:hypothetical protein